MIERIPDLIHTQTGEWNGVEFDIIPKETFAMVCRKVNELVDVVNALIKENNMHEMQIDELQMKVEPIDPVHKAVKSANNKLQNELEIAIDALNKIALVDDAGAQMVATAREALTKIGNITPR